jgi:hypothetical protein
MDLQKPGVAEALCFTLAFLVVIIGVLFSLISEHISNRKSKKQQQ